MWTFSGMLCLDSVTKVNLSIYHRTEMMLFIVSGNRWKIHMIHIRHNIAFISLNFSPSISIICKSIPVEHDIVVIFPSRILKSKNTMKTGSWPKCCNRSFFLTSFVPRSTLDISKRHNSRSVLLWRRQSC